MSSDTTATGFSFRRSEPMPGRMAWALVWAECRVGGVVAVVYALLGAALMVWMQLYIPMNGWKQQDEILLVILFGTPLLTALVLVLHPTNSGHLVGGFPERVLWLPVPMPIAVACAMVMRALFVFAVAAFLILFTGVVYEDRPPFAMAFTFVALYFLVQTADWSRAVFSGLTSLLVLIVVGGALLILSRLGTVLESVHGAIEYGGFTGNLLLVGVLGAASYATSIALVNATRRGRQFGIPEVWEWSSFLDRAGAKRLRPFQSPVGAQVWFELRSYGWTMPAVALLVPALLLAFAWLFVPAITDPVQVMADSLYAFLPLGALAHGIRARVLGIRPSVGKPGFAYLQTLPAEQMALAKSLTALIVMIPTVIVVVAIQNAVFAPAFLTEIVPHAWANGMTNAREVVWALGSRALLLGLGAWMLLAIGTRTLRRLALVAVVFGGLLVWLETKLPERTHSEPHEVYWQLEALMRETFQYNLPIHVYFEVGSYWFMLLLFAGTSVFVTLLALRRGLLSRRAVAAWGAAFLLTAWVIFTALPESLPYGPRTGWDYFNEVMLCLAWASILPLPFMATVLDASRRRHGASPRQESLKSLQPALSRRLALGMAAPTVLLIAWLTWPAAPAYQNYLHAISPPVQGDENISQKYLGLVERKRELDAALEDRWRESGEYRRGDVAIAGHGNWPMSERERAATEKYWEAVVAPLMPELKELAAKLETIPPGGFGLTFTDDLSVLSGLHELSRDAAIDVFYWSQRGDSRRTADAIIAISGVANSLSDDRAFISLLTATAMMGIGTSGLETSLGEVSFDDADLARVQAYLAASTPCDVNEWAERIIHWERVHSVTSLRQAAFEAATFISDSPKDTPGWLIVNPFTILAPFVVSPAAESMATLVVDDLIMQLPAGQYTYTERIGGQDFTVHLIAQKAEFLAPLTAETAGMSSLPDIVPSVWRARVQLDTARAGVAAERYRLAHGQWPESLDVLVPAYLDAVPIDHFARVEGAPLRHTVRDGLFVVYSVGPSGEDHGGRARWETKERTTDDQTFVVGRRRE